jgi:hypothetical protein
MNVATAALYRAVMGSAIRVAQQVKQLSIEGAKKGVEAKVAVAEEATDPKRAPRRCNFGQNCPGTQTPWRCKTFGYQAPQKSKEVC